VQQIEHRKLTAKELAAAYGCHVSTIYRLKLAGRLPHAQPGGKGHMVRFNRECLEIHDNEQQASRRPQETSRSHSGPKPKWLDEYENLDN